MISAQPLMPVTRHDGLLRNQEHKIMRKEATMHIRQSCFRKHLWGGLASIILVSIFIISGCANKPNLIPEGYSAILEKQIMGEKSLQIIRKEAAKLDYPITVAVTPTDEQVEIHWTNNGEIIWTEPFWTKVTWWRFALVSHEAPDGTPALCYTTWTKANSDDQTKVPCKLAVKNYIGKPLTAMLYYRLGGDEENPPGDEDVTPEVTRLCYLVLKD